MNCGEDWFEWGRNFTYSTLRFHHMRTYGNTAVESLSDYASDLQKTKMLAAVSLYASPQIN